ncbi:MAG TPA: manganese efflux pump MntP family protein [Spirochaetota bacterium]
MHLITTLLIATGLAMDAFSVCISAGIVISKPDFGHYFRLAFAFGFFQFLMPVIGYFLGITVEPYIKNFDHWLALILLSYIGGKMIHEGLKKDRDICAPRDPSRGKTLLILAIATSIDALAVGISYGVLSKPIVSAAIIIGIVCAAFSVLGITIGKKVGCLLGKRAEIIGGLCLIAIGVKILIDHIG